MARHTIKGEITRYINATNGGQVIGFEIKDEDLVELLDGRSWNPVHAVWGSGDLPPVGSIIQVTGKNFYEKTSDWVDINGDSKSKKQWNLRDITSLEALHTPKPVDEGAPF
jgi:hypothetical protein